MSFTRRNIRGESLEDRLRRYPNEVRHELLQWTAFLDLDPALVHQDSLEALQLKRVFLPSEHQDVLTELKSRNVEVDDLFGVAPRNPRQVLIARNGYSRWFEAAVVELIEMGVHYRSGVVAKPSIRKGRFYIDLDGEVYSPSHGFWCANPNPLGKALMPGVRWDGYSQLLTAWHFEAEKGTNSALSYVQFFGHPQGVIRATQYQFEGTQRVVVESLAPNRRTVNTAAPSILEAGRETGVTPGAFLGRFTRRAYLTLSVDDSHRLQELGQRLREIGWIHSGLQYFSRPRKLVWLDQEIQNSRIVTDRAIE